MSDTGSGSGILRLRRTIPLQRGVAEGQLPSGLDLSALASFYTTVVDGLAIQARDDASREALKFAVRCAMATRAALVREAGS